MVEHMEKLQIRIKREDGNKQCVTTNLEFANKSVFICGILLNISIIWTLASIKVESVKPVFKGVKLIFKLSVEHLWRTRHFNDFTLFKWTFAVKRTVHPKITCFLFLLFLHQVWINVSQQWMLCSEWVPSEWESDKNITIIHTTPVHQLTSGEDKRCVFVRNKSAFNLNPLLFAKILVLYP